MESRLQGDLAALQATGGRGHYSITRFQESSGPAKVINWPWRVIYREELTRFRRTRGLQPDSDTLITRF